MPVDDGSPVGSQQYSTDPVGELSSPRIINLVTEPQEREPLDLPYMHSWTVTHFNRLLGEFQASIEREPPVPKNAPLDFVPSEAQQPTRQPGPRWHAYPALLRVALLAASWRAGSRTVNTAASADQ
jgi:hypothetical protein